MNKFRFKFNIGIIVLLVLTFLISAGGLVWNIYNIVEYTKLGVVVITKILSFGLIIIIAVLAMVLSTSALVYSYYVIKGDELCVCIGLIRTKQRISDITEIDYFKKEQKLVMYMVGEKYSVIVIDKKNNEDFVMAVRKVNPKIIYENKTCKDEIE